MRKFFTGVWRVITFPFRLVFNIVAYPFRAVYRFFKLLNSNPEERPLAEIFADIATQKETRDALLDQIEAFRSHLLRSVLWLTLFIIAAFWVAEPLMSILAEPVNMGLVMIPMILLYFIGIGMSYLAHASRRKHQAPVEDPAGETETGFG